MILSVTVSVGSFFHFHSSIGSIGSPPLTFCAVVFLRPGFTALSESA